jgi:hypothetical protein
MVSTVGAIAPSPSSALPLSIGTIFSLSWFSA